jgi:hypothetical protein
MKLKHIAIVFWSLACLVLTGCANNPFSSYKATSDEHFNKIYSGNVKTAMDAKNTPDVLYNMEYGLLQRIDQQYDTSNIYFGRAQQVIDAWANSWSSTTAGELSTEALAMLVNDSATDYQPKGYEKTFLATYYALNHIDLNNFDNARIEIKRMYEFEQAIQNYNEARYHQQAVQSKKDAQDKTSNYLYQQILTKYDFSDIKSPKVLALKNSYQNAFSHYLAGFVFEALNEPSLARPGYVKAGQLNPTNTLIQRSIDNLDNGVRPKSGYTDLLIVEEVGHAPQVQSNEVHVAIDLNFIDHKKSCMNMINIFYPSLVLDKKNEALYDYSVDGRTRRPLPMVDVNLMAARALSDEVPHIISRNIAAALRNILAAQASCSEHNQLGSLLQVGTAISSQFIDKADERTLTLLPSKIHINRETLVYGEHTIVIEVNGVPYKQKIILDQPYQIIAFRILGNQVYFNTQQSMVKK